MGSFKIMRTWVLILVSLVWSMPPESKAQLRVEGAGKGLFIRNATLLTISDGVIKKGSIYIFDGKIAAIGPELAVPDGARVMEAEGCFIMPGIIDSHSHMASEGGINESSVNVASEVNIDDVIKPDDITIQRALAGGVTAVNTLHGSANPIGGRNAVIKLKFGRPAEELLVPGSMRGIKFALGENPKRSNSITPGSQHFPASRMGVMYVIREAFNQAKEYMKQWDEYELKKNGKLKKTTWEKKYGLVPPRRDLRMEALTDILRGKLRVICHAYRADEMLALMELGDEMGFRVGSFEHCLEGYKIAEEIAAHGVIASVFTDFWGYKMEAFDAIPYNAAILIDHGVTVTINSDSGERVRRLYQEAAKLLKYGVSEEEALKTITINPAITLGISDRVGTLEKGKDADLAIFNGHPFSVYSRCEMTLIEGKIYFDRNQVPTVAKLLKGEEE